MFQTQYGAYHEVSVDDPEVIKASEVAFKFYKKIVPDFSSLLIEEIISAERQVVRGFNYRIIFKSVIAETTFLYCETVVHKAPSSDSEFETKHIECKPTSE